MLPLRSLNDNESAYIQFQNETNRNVDIIWVNYAGDLQKYVTLKPRESVNIDTFKTHPWLFIDHDTGIKMRVGRDTIFYPIANIEIIRRLGLPQNQNFPIRIPVPIRLPLFTLRHISLQSVFTLLRDLNDIENLELPQTVKRDIRKLSQDKNDIISKYE